MWYLNLALCGTNVERQQWNMTAASTIPLAQRIANPAKYTLKSVIIEIIGSGTV